ncbi:glutamine synthetase [Nocardioides aromaticivorans]|uniref:Glutamine synthetase n=1 Tax=Nocardioides aromaticivorans TaxID=200618 RepID=A0ABX7PR82_9ACTN|nr:glutamine synthetase family protein [Nocardioides aromaticivorans]QSR28518.1 glutamine synthetase [Nocardioides aromaticivorans]
MPPDVPLARLEVPDLEHGLREKLIRADRLRPGDRAAHSTTIYGVSLSGDMTDTVLGHAGNGYPDASIELDELTRVSLPWAGLEAVIGDVVDHHGDPVGVSPRTMVQNLVERFGALGLAPVLGFEYEVWVFEADAGRDLPLPARLARAGAMSDLVAELARRMAAIGHPLSAVRSEAHAGFIEVSIAHGPALHAADGAARARRYLAELCAERDLIASFMAKPFGGREGAAGHVHASLERDGVNLFAGGELTAEAAGFVAGLVDSLPDLTLMFNPHVNSFKRIDPRMWVPTSASWGYDDRRAACRVVLRPDASARVEHRRGGADANPYVSASAVLAGGIDGLERDLALPQPRLPSRRTVPVSLGEAIAAFEDSSFVDRLLPRRFAEAFAATRRAELARYRAWLDENITPFELARHVERA